jgi:hypothetical protein
LKQIIDKRYFTDNLINGNMMVPIDIDLDGDYEILYTDTPFQIAIDEAIKLSKNFSEEKAKNFINGILDKIAKENLQ